jgi:acetylornithine deacetylase/succinyl-diaminopimelate desuccinylase-like protein
VLDRFALTRPIGIIGISEKTRLPLRLTAHGAAGHGSLPWPNSAPVRLVRALDRLLAARRPGRVLPEIRQFFATLAGALPAGAGDGYEDVARSLEDPGFREAFYANPHYAAAVGTTFALTVLRAGDNGNVVPAEAVAEVDCRLWPATIPARSSSG